MKRNLPAFGLKNVMRFCAVLLTLGLMFGSKSAYADIPAFNHPGVRDSVFSGGLHRHVMLLNVCRTSGSVRIDSFLSVLDADAGETETFSVVASSGGSFSPAFPTAAATGTGGTIYPSSSFVYSLPSGTGTSASFRIRVNDGTGATNTDTLFFYINIVPPAIAGAITSDFDAVRVGRRIDFTTPPFSGGTSTWATVSGGTESSVTSSGRVTGVSSGSGVSTTDSVMFIVTPSFGCRADTSYFRYNVLTSAPPVPGTSSVNYGIPGQTIVINGSGFNPTASNNEVYFGATKGTVISGTGTTSLTVQIPTGATFGRITVLDKISKLNGNITATFLPQYDTANIIASTYTNYRPSVNIPLTGGFNAGNAGVKAWSVEYGDLDGDGKTDVVTAGTTSNKIYIYRNISTNPGVIDANTYAAPDSIYTGSRIINIKIADIDGDGKPEIISACSGSEMVGINKNRSTPGTISMVSTAWRISTRPAPTELAIADFNNDGRTDIAVACAGYYEPATTGTLTYAGSVMMITNNYDGVAAGTDDITTASIAVNSFDTSLVQAYRDFGRDQPISIAAADIDNNGFIDLAVSEHALRKVAIFRNSTSSAGSAITFATKIPISVASGSTGFPNQVRFGDFDQDGKQDMVVAVTDSDLLTSNTYNVIAVYKNNSTTGSISLAFSDTIGTGVGPVALAVGDINGDHQPDIVNSNGGAGSVSIIRNTTSGGALSLTFDKTISMRGNPLDASIGIALGDADNNSVADIMVVNRDNNYIALFRGSPVPDTTHISGPDSVCIGSTYHYSSFHRPGSQGYWSLSNARATISTFGDTTVDITAVTAGNVVITYSVVSLADTNKVFDTIFIRPTGVSANTLTGAASVCQGATTTYTVTVPLGTWSTSNASVASVSSTGVVRGIAPGTARIFYTLGAPVCGSVQIDSQDVTVNALPNAGVIRGANRLCAATVETYSDSGASASGVWSTNTSTVATINASGVLMSSSSASGSLIISYTVASASCGSATDTQRVLIGGTPPSAPVVTGSTAINVGSSTTLTGTPTGGSFTNIHAGTLGTITSGGVYTGIAEGTDSVIYTVVNGCGSASDTFLFNVVSGTPPVIINVTPIDTMPKGTILITGNDFNASPTGNLVFFGSTLGTVLSGTTTSLTVRVPLGTPYGRIMVLDSASRLTAYYNKNNFMPYWDSSAMIPSTLNNLMPPYVIPLMGGRGADVLGVVSYSVEFGDLNMDSRPDLLVCGTGMDSVFIYLNTQAAPGSFNGTTYSAPMAVRVDALPFTSKIIDLDGDGKGDVVVASAGTGSISVLRNTTVTAGGPITFGSLFRIPSVGVGPMELAPGDFDNDGRTDIAVVCRGNAPTFAPSLAIAKNNYTRLAGGILSPSSFSVSTIATYTTAEECRSLVAADFNGDNLLDIAVSNQRSRVVSVYQNSSTSGTLSFPTRAGAFDIATDTVVGGTRSGYPNQVKVGDFNHDGFPDLAVAVTDSILGRTDVYNRVLIFRNLHPSTTLSRSSFDSKYEITADTGVIGISVGDLNGDRRADIVSTNSASGTISVMYNIGTGSGISFDAARTYLVDTVGSSSVATYNWGPVSVAINDIDTNTVNDIAVVSQAQNILSLFRMFPIPDTSAIVGSNTICAADSTVLTTFHRTGSRGYWSTVNGNAVVRASSGSDMSATLYGAHPGSDTVIYTVVALYDTNRVRFVVNITARPDSGSITGAVRVMCTGDTLGLSETVTGGTWSSSNTSIAVVDTTGRVTYSGPSTGTVIISYTTSNGYCSASDTFAVTVNPAPFAGVITGGNVVCVGVNDTLRNTSATPGASYTRTWHILRGHVSFVGATDTGRAIITATSFGADSVYYVEATGTSCGSDTAWFAVSSLVTGGSITITDSARRHNNLCVGISYTYRSNFPGGTWHSSDTAIATVDSTTGVVNGVRVGTFMLTYSITSATCGTYFDTLTVNIHPIDAGVISGPTVICVGGSDTLRETVSFGNWYSLNPSFFTITAGGVVTGVASGTDSAIYVISSTACGANDTAFHTITVTTTAHSVVTAGAATICAGGVILDTTSVRTTGSGGSWSSSDTSVATVSAAGLVTGHRRGSVNIRYTVVATCGTVSDSVVIAVDTTPVAGIIIGDTVCAGSTLALRDSAGTTGGTWSSSDPTIASIVSTTGVLTGVHTGSVTVKYVVTGFCGADSVTKVIVVDTIRTPSVITGIDSICAGGSTTFSDSVAGGAWTSSDTSIARVSASGVVSAVGAATTFRSATIRYTISNHCGSSSVTKPVYIKPNADSASFTVPAVLCDTDAISLTPTIGGGVWTTSAPATATVDSATGVVTGRRGSVTGSSVVITYTRSSVFGCASGVSSRTLVVYSKPTATITPASAILCVGSSTTYFGNTPIGTTGAWSTGTHTAISQDIVGRTDTVTGVTTGIDSITYILTSNVGCGSGVATQVISVDSTPFAGVVAGPSAVCFDSFSSPLPFTATGASGYTSSSWITGTTDLTIVSSTDSTATVIATGQGNIDVIHIVNARCGSDTTRFTVSAEFNADAGIDSVFAAICPGTSDTVTTYTRRGSSFATRWFSSDTSVVTVTTGSINAVVTAVLPGASTVRTAFVYVVDSNQCGTDTAMFTFTVNPSIPSPGVITSVTGGACIGALSTLSDTVTGGTWSSGNTGIATINSSGIVTPVTPGTVTIYYIVSNICGTDTATYDLKVSRAAKLIVPTVAPVCDSSLLSVNLTADSASASFAWSRPAVAGVANVSDTGTGNIREYLDDTTGSNVIVKYVVVTSLNGCSSSDSFTVTVKPTPYLTTPLGDTVCSGAGAFITFSASTGGGTIGNWTRPNVTNITPAGPVSGIGNIGEVLINTVSIPVIVPYTYTLTFNGCTNTGLVNVTVNPSPANPKIVTHSPPNLCKSTDYMNFGASSVPPAGVTYYWTADNAQVWATGRSKQYSLVNFGWSGTSIVYLNAIYPGYICPARDSFIVNVSETVSDSPRVIYWNGDFVCLSNDRDTYQWGYDDIINLDSAMFEGQTNQNYTELNPDFTGKYYWCITSKDGCIQKSYFRIPTTVQTVTGVIGDVKLYPNPAEQFVNVEINGATSGQFTVEVVDMLGKHIGTYDVQNHKVTIGIGELASGIYFVECYHDGVKFNTSKFVKN